MVRVRDATNLVEVDAIAPMRRQEGRLTFLKLTSRVGVDGWLRPRGDRGPFRFEPDPLKGKGFGLERKDREIEGWAPLGSRPRPRPRHQPTHNGGHNWGKVSSGTYPGESKETAVSETNRPVEERRKQQAVHVQKKPDEERHEVGYKCVEEVVLADESVPVHMDGLDEKNSRPVRDGVYLRNTK